jgi:aryl-alcohol dehydrogenase-like predicted oxidoreductase
VEQRHVGRSGLSVSWLGLGTLTWGRDTDEHEAAEQLKEFMAAGGTLVATGGSLAPGAAPYGDGVAEEVLGSLLRREGGRSELVISAKAPGTDLSRRGLLGALDRTLARLDTDHVDVWVVPGWSRRTPVEETLSALELAVTSGRARYVGVANLTGWQTVLMAAYARLPAGTPVLTEVEYSMVQRGVEREVLPATGALGLGVVGWSPLGRGVLTGKYRGGVPADSRAASTHLAEFVEPYLGRGARRVVDAVVTAAEGLDCSPLEVAIAWVRDRPAVSAVLAGARTAAQLRAVLAAEEVRLPREIRAVLDEVSAPVLGYPELLGPVDC